MKIELIRRWPRRDYIIGELHIDGRMLCHTMEPPRPEDAPKGRAQCIPCGTYKVVLYPSAKFRGMRPILLDVPGRSGILIHEGNFPKDTTGCILVGRNSSKGTLAFSRNTLKALLAYPIAEGCSITVTEQYA